MKMCPCIEYGIRADGEEGYGIMMRPYRKSFMFHGQEACIARNRYGSWVALVFGVPIDGGHEAKTQAQAERLAVVCSSIRAAIIPEAFERAKVKLQAARDFGYITKLSRPGFHIAQQ